MSETQKESSKKFITDSPKVNFFMGLILGIAIISTVGFFVGGFSKGTVKPEKVVDNKNNNNPQIAGEQEQKQPVVDLKIAEGDHVLGDKNAPIKIFEFSDFQCPYCSKHHATLQQLVKEYDGKVVWIFKQFPIQSHPLGMPGALASECANEQGKFWEMADKIFAGQETLTEASFAKFAQDLGLDMDKFNSCYSQQKYKDKILADYNLGIDSGVQGTPSNFINNQLVPGALPYDNIKGVVDDLLKNQ